MMNVLIEAARVVAVNGFADELCGSVDTGFAYDLVTVSADTLVDLDEVELSQAYARAYGHGVTRVIIRHWDNGHRDVLAYGAVGDTLADRVLGSVWDECMAADSLHDLDDDTY